MRIVTRIQGVILEIYSNESFGGFFLDIFPIVRGECFPKIVNIYGDVLSLRLDVNSVGCSFSGKSIKHLYYANDMVILDLLSNWVQ